MRTMPHCPSHEVYKGILTGRAKAVFNGKIIVRPDAQKTDAQQAHHDRTILCEYHAVGSPTGAFMLVDGRWKYHHYVGFAPELFDLRKDPEELHDLAASAAHQGVVDQMRDKLQVLLDPVAVDRLAKDDQNTLVARHGGREAALAVGKIGATPVPAAARGGGA